MCRYHRLAGRQDGFRCGSQTPLGATDDAKGAFDVGGRKNSGERISSAPGIIRELTAGPNSVPGTLSPGHMTGIYISNAYCSSNLNY